MISLNRAQKRRLAKPWRVRKYLANLERQNARAEPVGPTKRKRPRRHNGYDRPETGTAG
jgi:hypothetical protein